NLHVEFSNLQSYNYPDWLVSRFGADRLLFGSEMPLKTPGAARALIDYADISTDDKKLIAGENLKRLLKIESLTAIDWKPADSFIEKASQGQPMPIAVIDAHSHSGHMGEFNGAAMVHMPNSNPAQMAAKFKRLGVEKICISSWLGIWSDSVRGNKLMQETVEESPETYIPYVTIDPNFLSDEEIAAEIETYHEKLRFPGMKPYFPRSQYRLTGPKLAQWFEYGNKNHLYALIHYDFGTTVADINTLAPQYPELTFIIAHSGCSYRATRAIIELAKKYPNVVAEITFTAVLSNAIELLCREIGSDRVLFGADAPMRDPAPQMAWVVYANISPEAKKQILQENMQRILDHCWT
ncbi:amidohydrolase family protein, partial [bacterium]|nr:amidohydrolase family protein [bacterium]